MAVFGMVTLAILYRKLSVVEMGIYIFFMAILGLIDVLRSGFLTITIVKFYSGTSLERGRQIAGSAWCIALAITGVSVVINIPTYFLSDHVSDQGLVLFMKYFSLVSLITLPCFMANCIVQAEKEFGKLLWFKIMIQGSFALMIFLLAIFGKITLNAVLIAYGLSNLLSSIVVLTLKWTMISAVKYADRETIRELFHFGKYAMGTNIGSNLFNVTNTFAINFFIGPAGLAIFNLGSKFMQVIEIPMVSFAATGMPILSFHYNNGEHVEMMYALKKLIGMMTIVLIPCTIFALLFAEPIILLLGGEANSHNEAPNIFRMLMVFGLLGPADRFFALALDVIHQPKVNFYKIILMLVVYAVAIVVGVEIYHSIYSIAIAGVFPTIVAILITYVPLNRYHKFSFWGIYVIGYKEVMLFIKQLRTQFLQR
ncbi:Membrane protein involved in the export of O-antigen and teichoic acid [Pedobacter westerhofensis]|uniref:Membrane protein involved in the export of O-antigen and teichoic acid n=2 Tax=Pedobacter westerhofensis TaxID=425512 RepID=A0A521E8K5_9SPHI|nr:Membrane protein involved in the export of O-antigen and teichoic acid [Pedobacter westerhofensis]